MVSSSLKIPPLNERITSIGVIVPVYNRALESVPAAQLQSDTVHITFYACDNSTRDDIKIHNARMSSDIESCVYIDMEENAGFSKACNRVIGQFDEDVYCVFDDDTIIPGNYLSCLINEVEKFGYGIYVPLVMSNGAFLSPLNRFGPMIFRYKSFSEVDEERCFAFNSGMAYTRAVAAKVSYDENLFLEFVDHAFCRDARKAGIPFHILKDVVLEQDYSVQTNDLQAALHRDRIGKKDVKQYYSSGIVNYLYGKAYLLYRLVRNCRRYKTTAFLFD